MASTLDGRQTCLVIADTSRQAMEAMADLEAAHQTPTNPAPFRFTIATVGDDLGGYRFDLVLDATGQAGWWADVRNRIREGGTIMAPTR